MYKLGLNQQRGHKLNRSEVNKSEREHSMGESSWVWEKQLTYQLVSGERLQTPLLQSAVFVTEHQLNSPLCDPPDLRDPSNPNKHQI